MSRGKLWNYMILHDNNPEGPAWFKEKMIPVAGKEPLSILNISPVIGMHVGNNYLRECYNHRTHTTPSLGIPRATPP